MGNEFASDGYIWAHQETAFQLEIAGGYVCFAMVITTLRN